MAITTGPLHSIEAHGTFAKTLTFARRRRSTTTYNRPIPRQPRTDRQVAQRVMVGFLSSEWKTLSASEIANWSGYAETQGLSPFNSYIRYNVTNWTRGMAPSRDYPAARILDPLDPTALGTLPNSRRLIVGFLTGTFRDCWALALYRSVIGGFTGSKENLVFLGYARVGVLMTHHDYPLTPGVTYFYRARVFSPDGSWGTFTGQISGVPLP